MYFNELEYSTHSKSGFSHNFINPLSRYVFLSRVTRWHNMVAYVFLWHQTCMSQQLLKLTEIVISYS